MDTMIEARVPWLNGGRSSSDPYEELAAAIVETAYEDYVKTIKAEWNTGLSTEERKKLILDKIELETFFHSQWYEFLTDIDPDKLMAQCLIIAKAQEKKAAENENKRRLKSEIREKQNIPAAEERFKDYLEQKKKQEKEMDKDV